MLLVSIVGNKTDYTTVNRNAASQAKFLQDFSDNNVFLNPIPTTSVHICWPFFLMPMDTAYMYKSIR